MATNVNRVILLIAYVAVSMGLLFLFGGFSSSGPLQALFILTGWTVIIYGFLHLAGWPLFLVVFVLYLIAVLLLSDRIKPMLRLRLPLVPCLIHSIGVAICFLMPGRDEVGVGFIVNVLAWIIPLALVLFYFLLEGRLARRVKEPEA